MRRVLGPLLLNLAHGLRFGKTSLLKFPNGVLATLTRQTVYDQMSVSRRFQRQGERRICYSIIFADDSEDDDEENEMDEKENHRASRRAKSSSAKGRKTSVRRSTRNQRQVSKSSEESEDDVSSLDESVDSEPKIPGNGASQRSALSDKLPEANKR